MKLDLLGGYSAVASETFTAAMRVISVIEDEDVIKKILKHLRLWDRKPRPPPKATSPPMTPEYQIGYTDSQLPPSDKWLLLAGDHILIHITPNIQCWADDYDPLKDYLASLDKVNDLDIELVLPGHRRLITDPKGRITELKEHHRKRLDEVLEILTNEPKTAYEVASQMTWDIHCDSWDDFPRAQKWFATGEAIAHLRYLERKSSILQRDEDALIVFSRKS